MVEPDVEFIKKCLNSSLIKSPCLELGVGYQGPNNKGMIEAANIEYFGTDIIPGDCVDYVVDFEDSAERIKEKFDGKKFGCVLVLNVLEHTFNPIQVLDGVFGILQPKGTCIIITPTVWPLHDFPRDCWRINPNFYEEYCKRRSLNLLTDYFEYVGFHKVQERTDDSGSYVLPSPSRGVFKRLRSKVIHKLFNTCGRAMFFPSHVATGVVIEKPADK